MKKIFSSVTAIMILALIFTLSSIMISCGGKTKLYEEGKIFKFDSKHSVVINQTTKKQILDTYGQPTSLAVKGKYQILRYYHKQESMKSKRGIGLLPLASIVPIPGAGLATSIAGTTTAAVSDNDMTDDIIKEWEEMIFYIDLTSGVVKDYYYHDSKLKGHDDSESLYLVSLKMINKGENEKAIETLKKAVRLNPVNHRALKVLAWQLIDLEIDIEKGLKYAKEAIKIFPDSPYNNGVLGIGYFKNREFDKAEEYLQSAIDLFPVYAPYDYKTLQYDKAFLERIKQQQNQ